MDEENKNLETQDETLDISEEASDEDQESQEVIPEEEKTDLEEQEDIPEIPEDWAYPKVYQPTVTLGDGTELIGFVNKVSFSNKLWILLEGSGFSYAQIITMFNNPENTQVIRFSQSASERIEYIGYTHLATINSEPNGKFNIGLTKPEA